MKIPPLTQPSPSGGEGEGGGEEDLKLNYIVGFLMIVGASIFIFKKW
jgi:hypothetical protein